MRCLYQGGRLRPCLTPGLVQVERGLDGYDAGLGSASALDAVIGRRISQSSHPPRFPAIAIAAGAFEVVDHAAHERPRLESTMRPSSRALLALSWPTSIWTVSTEHSSANVLGRACVDCFCRVGWRWSLSLMSASGTRNGSAKSPIAGSHAREANSAPAHCCRCRWDWPAA